MHRRQATGVAAGSDNREHNLAGFDHSRKTLCIVFAVMEFRFSAMRKWAGHLQSPLGFVKPRAGARGLRTKHSGITCTIQHTASSVFARSFS